ncbi:uncharacterized protein [Dermacentor andersoni]|uniref:uncharacterized protein n=1 Tax=Dermacentor andersoni TaxID=34620 RepID=UPI0021554BE7|nr:uncharacterized protein LOC126527365 [Dermacentor andersoni]
MRDITVIISPLALIALLEAVTARPSLVLPGAAKPSKFDEYAIDPPDIVQRGGLHEQRPGSDDELDVTLSRLPAELAPAHGLRYHDVVYDISSETAGYYDDDRGPQYRAYSAPAYKAAHSASRQTLRTGSEASSVPSEVVKRSLGPSGLSDRSRPVTEAPRKAPFSVGYTREEDDWLLLSTRHHDPHWEAPTAYRVPPFTVAVRR